MPDEKQTVASQTIESLRSEAPELRDRRPKPEGVVPKQSQAYVIAGLAVLILLAVMFSNNRAKPTAKPSAAAPAVFSSDANQRNIEELKRDLTEDQWKSEQQAQAQKAAGAGPSSPAGSATQASTTTNNNLQPTSEPPRDPVNDAERALNFKARFASNLVAFGDTAPHSPTVQSQAVNQPASPFEQMAVSLNSAVPPQNSVATQAAGRITKPAPEVNVNSAFGHPYVLFEGVTIDTALVNRLDGEFSGPVKAMVTNAVYSQDRQPRTHPRGHVPSRECAEGLRLRTETLGCRLSPNAHAGRIFRRSRSVPRSG